MEVRGGEASPRLRRTRPNPMGAGPLWAHHEEPLRPNEVSRGGIAGISQPAPICTGRVSAAADSMAVEGGGLERTGLCDQFPVQQGVPSQKDRLAKKWPSLIEERCLSRKLCPAASQNILDLRRCNCNTRKTRGISEPSHPLSGVCRYALNGGSPLSTDL